MICTYCGDRLKNDTRLLKKLYKKHIDSRTHYGRSSYKVKKNFIDIVVFSYEDFEDILQKHGIKYYLHRPPKRGDMEVWVHIRIPI